MATDGAFSALWVRETPLTLFVYGHSDFEATTMAEASPLPQLNYLIPDPFRLDATVVHSAGGLLAARNQPALSIFNPWG